MRYRPLSGDEIDAPLFSSFIRRQEVTLCLRRIGGAWRETPAPFIDDWDEEDYAFLVRCLRGTVRTGGVVFGAFSGGELKGFASVEAAPAGSRGQYRDLTSLHVSADLRRHGAGKQLFALAAAWARSQGAQKLYISSHSAVESQAFYRRMGCVEAVWQDPVHVAQEPFDCQLERVL